MPTHIKRYDEILNEGLYDWMNKIRTFDLTNNVNHFMPVLGSAFFLLSQIISCFRDDFSFEINDPFINWYIFSIMIGVLSIPLTNPLFSKYLKKLYDFIRGKTLLKKTNSKIKELEEYIKENDSDIFEEIMDIKSDLREAIDNKNKSEMSRCIHEIFELSLKMKNRKEYGFIYTDISDEEKEYNNRKNKDKKDKKDYLKRIDPLGEENWEDQK